MNIYLIPNEVLFPNPSISHYLQQPTYFPIVLSSAPLPFSVLVVEVGVVHLSPFHTPVSAVMSVLLTRSAGAGPSNTTPSAVPGGMAVRFMPVKSIITPWVPNFLVSIGSPSTSSVEHPFPCRFQVNSALSDEPDEAIYCLILQWSMIARAGLGALPF